MAMTEFYCCDCEKNFDSEPDGTGYEQAPCPECKQTCMTAEFEGKSSKEEKKVRFVVVGEFFDKDAAEPLIEELEKAEIPIEVNLPDIVEGDMFTGGNDNLCVLVLAELADQARAIMEGMGGQKPASDDESE